MSKRLKVGARVADSYLGEGTIVERLPGGWGYSVLWDTTPHVFYNMGQNPCQWWPKCHETRVDVSEAV